MEVKKEFVQAIKDMMSELESGINKRNAYINRRYDVVHGTGIMNGLKIKSGWDATQYNYLPRVLEIHKSQLIGRMFQVVSSYDKEDLSIYELGVTDQEAAASDKEKARLRNARKATDAGVRNDAVKNIMKDNDEEAFWSRAADVAGLAGFAAIKHWKDTKGKTYKMSLLETPQNFWRHWTNSNFREWDADMYTYQMGEAAARRLYGSKLKDGENFRLAKAGQNYNKAYNVEDLVNDQQKNVWVCDFTGFVPGYAPDGADNVKKVPYGEEKELSALIVGDCIIQILDGELPEYEVIPNLEVPGDPWGKSDISDELIQVNQTLIETLSDYRTASWKITFPKIKFMGFADLELPSINNREAQGFALGEDQDILPVNMPDTLARFPELINMLMDSFVKLSKISRVMFDDPTINTASNQGLMTSMKALIDVTEDKQKRWSLGIRNIFTSALKSVADLDPALKEAIEDQAWTLQVKWPSVLRREDSAYQQMFNNRMTLGTISFASYLEAMGDNSAEELDRIRDEMTDKTTAAILGRQLPALAASLITPPSNEPNVKYNVSLRGETTPEQEGNIASKIGINDGPFPPSMGPQGNEGLNAYEQSDNANSGTIAGGVHNGGTPVVMGPDGQPVQADAAHPSLTADQNSGQGMASIPGSGMATPASSQGRMDQLAQNSGA